MHAPVISWIILGLLLCKGCIQCRRQHEGQLPSDKQSRDSRVIGSASSGPHCFRIKAGKPSGPVADVTSSCLRIFKTSRSRMRRNLSRVCRGGLGSENSLAPSSGNCDFAENVEANRRAFEAGSFAHVSPDFKGGIFSEPVLFARSSYENFHQSLEDEFLSLSRVLVRNPA